MAKKDDMPVPDDPFVIGYWARIYDLTYEQVCFDDGPVAAARDSVDDGRNRFMEGWNLANEELFEEQFSEFRAQLADVEDNGHDQAKRAAKRYRYKRQNP